MQSLATGLRTQQIAHKMELKPVTVEFHFRKARQKLGVSTREHALAKALSFGLISL
ncbi:MAG: LuxR C-terminal-related transcriptional regulator [Devosiaceae bacterium]|nr:LuxR C-terminal-related transcriptional regulator [Devosiaceae bacterium]